MVEIVQQPWIKSFTAVKRPFCRDLTARRRRRRWQTANALNDACTKSVPFPTDTRWRSTYPGKPGVTLWGGSTGLPVSMSVKSSKFGLFVALTVCGDGIATICSRPPPNVRSSLSLNRRGRTFLSFSPDSLGLGISLNLLRPSGRGSSSTNAPLGLPSLPLPTLPKAPISRAKAAGAVAPAGN
jgi:hypothetical protein